VDGSIESAAALRFDKHNPQHLTAVCTYCTIIELTRSELTLVRNEDASALAVVLRSLFEAYADFKAVLVDPDYYKSMYATFLEERLRFLRNVVKAQDNPFFRVINDRLNAPEQIAAVEAELNKYKMEGRLPISTARRFAAGGLQHEYQSMYWLLCLAGHNNMSALDDRHIEKKGDEFEVKLFKDVEPAELIRILDSLLAIAIDAGMRMHKLFETDRVAQYEAYQKQLNDIRAAYAKA